MSFSIFSLERSSRRSTPGLCSLGCVIERDWFPDQIVCGGLCTMLRNSCMAAVTLLSHVVSSGKWSFWIRWSPDCHHCLCRSPTTGKLVACVKQYVCKMCAFIAHVLTTLQFISLAWKATLKLVGLFLVFSIELHHELLLDRVIYGVHSPP